MEGVSSGRNLVRFRFEGATCCHLRAYSLIFTDHLTVPFQLYTLISIFRWKVMRNFGVLNQVVAVPMPLRDDPEITLGALRWVIDQALRPGDIVHIVHVVKCMVQKLEVYHGVPGTSYSFEEPGGMHHENEDVARAKSFLADSVMPILDARGIQHQTHLSVETVEAPPSAVAQIIFSAADSIGADMVIMGANRKPVTEEDGSLGKVAKYALENAQRPLVITRAFQPVPVASDALL